MLHPNRNSFFVSWGAALALALVATGCTIDTRSCPSGFRFPVNDEGRVVGDCVPVADAGADLAMPEPCGGACEERLCVSDECVACLEDDDCGGGAPFCSDENECVTCVDAPDRCTGATDVCNADTGACVQCTADSADACGAAGCTPSNTCSQFGTTQRTCEQCDTDANCATNHRCVPMEFEGAPRPGAYCLQVIEGSCPRPYTVAIDRQTLAGEGGQMFCGIDESLTSCEAVRAFTGGASCPGGADEECPQPGGLCRQIGLAEDQCTYPCTAPQECPDGRTCNASGFCDDP